MGEVRPRPPFPFPFPPFHSPKFSDKPVWGKVRSSEGEVSRVSPYKYHPDQIWRLKNVGEGRVYILGSARPPISKDRVSRAPQLCRASYISAYTCQRISTIFGMVAQKWKCVFCEVIHLVSPLYFHKSVARLLGDIWYSCCGNWRITASKIKHYVQSIIVYVNLQKPF